MTRPPLMAAAILFMLTAPAGGFAADKMDFSPLTMFQQADAVVKAVMVSLAIAAAADWIVLVAKRLEIGFATRRIRLLIHFLATRSGLEGAAAQNCGRVGNALLRAAMDEIVRSQAQGAAFGVEKRIALRLARIEAAAIREISLGVSLLATIGATAPFVGLFGTVWGIMNSFIGISRSQTTTLAVVAPGIAEALLATATGLVAAIPAVVFYNYLARSVGAYRALAGDAVASISVLASRELARNGGAGKE